jgi:hypothetical protein
MYAVNVCDLTISARFFFKTYPMSLCIDMPYIANVYLYVAGSRVTSAYCCAGSESEPRTETKMLLQCSLKKFTLHSDSAHVCLDYSDAHK